MKLAMAIGERVVNVRWSSQIELLVGAGHFLDVVSRLWDRKRKVLASNPR